MRFSVGRGIQSAEDGDLIKYLLFLMQKVCQEDPFSPWRGPANRTGYIKKKKQVEWLVSVQENHPHTGECCPWTHVSWLIQGHCLHTRRLSFASLSRMPGCDPGRWALGLCASGRWGRLCLFWLPGLGGNAGESQGWECGRNTAGVGCMGCNPRELGWRPGVGVGVGVGMGGLPSSRHLPPSAFWLVSSSKPGCRYWCEDSSGLSKAVFQSSLCHLLTVQVWADYFPF